MLTMLKRLLWDEAFFRSMLSGAPAALRSAILLVGVLIHAGIIPLGATGYWGGWVVMASALLVKAGEKNVPLLDQIKALTPEETAALSAHFGSKP